MKYEDLKVGMSLAEEYPKTIFFITHKDDHSLRANVYEFSKSETGAFTPYYYVDADSWDQTDFFNQRILLKDLGHLEKQGLIVKIMNVTEIVKYKRGG
jgi:hypothetical protein